MIQIYEWILNQVSELKIQDSLDFQTHYMNFTTSRGYKTCTWINETAVHFIF